MTSPTGVDSRAATVEVRAGVSCFVLDAIVTEIEFLFVMVFVWEAVDELGDPEQFKARDRQRVLCELLKLEEL